MSTRLTFQRLVMCTVVGLAVMTLGCRGQQSTPADQQSAPAAAPAPLPPPAPPPATEPPAKPSAQAPAPAPRRSPAADSAASTSKPAETAAAPPPAPLPPPPPPPPPPPRTYTMKAGTPLAVYTTTTLSTGSQASGERFTATLAKAIVDGDWVIAKEGARLEGVVVQSDPGGKVKGVASIAVGLRSLTLADGRSVEIQTNTVSQEAASSKKKDARKIGIGAGVGAAVGAIAGGGSGAAIGAAVGGGAGTAAALATRGDAATIPAETMLNFTVEKGFTVTKTPTDK